MAASGAFLIVMGLLPAGLLLPAGPAHGLQELEAADNAELQAEIAADSVNRIALENDRVIRVVQAPGGLTVEHDPVRGDVYLYPDGRIVEGEEPMVLYLGTERGLTYRLSLRVADRGSAQILIRNADLTVGRAVEGSKNDPYAEELATLIRAVARRDPLPGYAVSLGSGMRLVEVWRGPRWTARVLRVGDAEAVDAAAIAAGYDGYAAAAWVSETDHGPGAGRLAVVVEASDPSGTDR